MKITQGHAVAIAAHDHVPDHLLVFHLDTATGTVKTIYNGSAAPAWDSAGNPNGRRQRRLSFASLREIEVTDEQKLPELEQATA